MSQWHNNDPGVENKLGGGTPNRSTFKGSPFSVKWRDFVRSVKERADTN